MLDLTQARPAITRGQRPIVIAGGLADAYAALRDVGLDPDDPRAYTAVLTPIHAPLSHVIGARPETSPVIDVLGDDVELSRPLENTLEYLRGRGWPGIRGGRDDRDGDVGDKSERGPRETPRPKPAPAPKPAAIA